MNSEDSDRSGPPSQLVAAAAWTWRALVLVAGGWVLFQAAKTLYLLTLPFAAGILLTALAWPLVAFLRRRGAPRALAVLAAGVTFLVLVGGIATWVVVQAITQGSSLVSSAQDALSDLPISNDQLDSIRDNLTGALNERADRLAGPALNGLLTVGEFATGVIITVFVAFYLLYRGDMVWRWAVSLVPHAQRDTVRQMGPGMWSALSGWIRGTAIIATFHGVAVGLSLLLMGVPLAAPLGVLVFLGSFIPIIGAFIFGGFATLVAFADQGWVSALIVVGILVGLNQFEAHVLQPFLIGRYVELNALAVVAALTVGGLLWGVAGAVLAVPLTAAVHAGLKARRESRPTDGAQPAEPEDRPSEVPETAGHEAAPAGSHAGRPR